MRKYILIYRTNVKRVECLPALYDDGREALGAALVELDRLMREAGFNGRYALYPPYRAGDSVNLTAVSERTITHFGQEALTASATRTTRRRIGSRGGWGFGSTDEGDATLVESAALAHWAARTTRRDPNRKSRAGC
jgi:hypothetical protein